MRVYEHLQRLSLGFHQQRQKGDLLTRVTGDVNAMGDLFSQSLGADGPRRRCSRSGWPSVLLGLDPVLALVSFATSPLLAALSCVYRRRVRSQARVRRAQDGRDRVDRGRGAVGDGGRQGVRLRGATRADARARAGSEERMAAGVEVARLQARFDGLVGAVRAIGTALVLVVGVLRVAHGAISPGELIVFVSYTRKAHNPMRSIARETTKVAAAMAQGRADRRAARRRRGARGAARAPTAAAARAGDVALEGVSFAYGADAPGAARRLAARGARRAASR